MYIPVNPGKYISTGKIKPGGTRSKFPMVRSNWERQICIKLDNSPNVIAWASEELTIAYWCPIKKKRSNYYPDFLVKVQTPDNGSKIYLLEIKPYKDTTITEAAKRKSTKKRLYQESVVLINRAKWAAAKAFCESKGWTFLIITENNFKFIRA